MDNEIKMQPTVPVIRRNLWPKVLSTSIIFYFLLLLTIALTGNSNLFPALVMVCSFMVPVTFVAFLYEHRHLSRLTMPTVSLAFLYGGLVGLVAASILEPVFISQLNLGAILRVGLIEEFAKILGVVLIARHRRHDSEMAGLILGAAAGMGFAALESMGYAFTAFLESNGSISTTVAVTLVRGLLSPLGHGTWTAILASVLFRESTNGHFRINLSVIGAYLLVSILHSLWDGLTLVANSVSGQGVGEFVVEGIIGIIGLFVLWIRWREAVRLQTIMPPETEDI